MQRPPRPANHPIMMGWHATMANICTLWVYMIMYWRSMCLFILWDKSMRHWRVMACVHLSLQHGTPSAGVWKMVLLSWNVFLWFHKVLPYVVFRGVVVVFGQAEPQGVFRNDRERSDWSNKGRSITNQTCDFGTRTAVLEDLPARN